MNIRLDRDYDSIFDINISNLLKKSVHNCPSLYQNLRRRLRRNPARGLAIPISSITELKNEKRKDWSNQLERKSRTFIFFGFLSCFSREPNRELTWLDSEIEGTEMRRRIRNGRLKVRGMELKTMILNRSSKSHCNEKWQWRFLLPFGVESVILLGFYTF